MVNYDDARRQIEAAGLLIDKPLEFDGRIQRWKVEGEKAEKRGWTRLREWTSKAGNRYIVGAYGVWHGNDDGYTKIELPKRDDPKAPTLSDEDVAAIRAAQKEAARKLADERKREAKIAAAWAAQVWAQCPPCTDHEYLTRKGIRCHGLRQLNSLDGLTLDGVDDSNWWRLSSAVGALVVPMHDTNGNINGIQFIYGKGHPRREKTDKEFWPAGMAMAGTFGLIGPVQRAGILLVAEGYATAASLYEATGQSMAYAFSANNLAKAGKLLRKAYPALRLLFCADDDYLTDGNPGCTAAANATAEIEKSAWLKPDFRDEAGLDRRGGKKLTDFNDLAHLAGVPLPLANQVNARLDELKWRDTPSSASPNNGGGGEGPPKEDGRPRARSVMSLDELVDRFVPLDDGTGKYLFDRWTRKIASREQMIALLPAGMRADDIKRHPVWQTRGAYYLDQVGFDPSEKDPITELNTWCGWPMQPKSGECSMLLETLYYLCGEEGNKDEVYHWLLCWMAYPLQHPGAKMSSAVIMHGPQGTGKSTIFQTLARIYGDYATILNQRGLEDRFNADWIDSKLFILAEEVVARAEMWHIKNELKELVTGEWVRINPKNIAAYRQRNRVNIAYLSNENQPLPLDNDDRRHLVIYNPPAQAESYYDQLYRELDEGGTEAFYHHLMHLDLGDFHPKKRPPMTAAKRTLINLSKPSEYRFIDEWIDGQTEWPLLPCLANDLYAAYLRWSRINGEAKPRPANHFKEAIGRIDGWEKKKCRVHDNTHYSGATYPRWMILPPDSLLEAAGNTRPIDKSPAEWLTDCVFRFNESQHKEEERWST